MKRVMVRYKVKADRAGDNQRYIEKVFEELHASGPEGLRYASFKLDDGVSFVHIASIETDDGQNPLSNTAAFKAFQEGSMRGAAGSRPVARHRLVSLSRAMIQSAGSMFLPFSSVLQEL
jgi:hypothetical protein